MAKDRNDINEFVRQRIIELKSSADLSDKKISEAIGYSMNYINKITSGSNLPSFTALEAICEFFNITVSDFFKKDFKGTKSAEFLYRKMDEIIDEEDVATLLLALELLGKSGIKDMIKVLKRLVNIETDEE